MKRIVEKTIRLQFLGQQMLQGAITQAFSMQALKENWTTNEIALVLREAGSRDFDHFLKTIMNHCAPQNILNNDN